MVYSDYVKQRIVYHHSRGLRCTAITVKIWEEGWSMTVLGVWKFLKRYEQFHTIARRSGSGRPTKITPEIKAIVEYQMKLDDETTAVQLQTIF